MNRPQNRFKILNDPLAGLHLKGVHRGLLESIWKGLPGISTLNTFFDKVFLGEHHQAF
jgi:hypothetical protein